MRLILLLPVDGREIIVGKTVVVDGDVLVYNQTNRVHWHRELNSPCGIDLPVVKWMRAHQVARYDHYAVDERHLFSADLVDIEKYGVPVSDGNRPRLFLPRPCWYENTDGRGYHVPYIENKLVLPVEETGETCKI